MAIQTVTINVEAQPTADRIQTFLVLSQNENGRQIRFRILGDELPAGCTATLSGEKPDGNVWSKALTSWRLIRIPKFCASWRWGQHMTDL